MTATEAHSGQPAAALPAWHVLDVADVARQLAVDPAIGLPEAEVASRQHRFGENAIAEAPPRSLWRIILDQFNDFMILVLLAAAVVSGIVGDLQDTIAIIVIVVINAAIGVAQEIRAERAMAALKQMAANLALVLRDGQQRTVPAHALVPGDIVLLEAGNIVPADVRLLDAIQCKVDEALLTGEAVTADKGAGAMVDADRPLGDRRNMAYKGTIVRTGRARGLVTATGMRTELGKIAALLGDDVVPATPLQKRLTVFGRHLGYAVLVICAIVFALGLLRGEPPAWMFLTAVSLAVAAIPEALPAVVTIALALGARKMAQQQALIRRLPAVETLGSITTICSDKTGTLTQNRMEVVQFYAAGVVRDHLNDVAAMQPWQTMLTALALSNDASANPDGTTTGDPTEVALYLAARKAGVDKTVLAQHAPRVGELPFDAERRRMTTCHRIDGALVSYTKGAPESVLPLCAQSLDAMGAMTGPPDRAMAVAHSMARQGLRVLAIACRRWDATAQRHPIPDSAALETDLVFIGLVGLMDPPRAEAKEAVRLCQSAGITPVMITGDHAATALAIAVQLGIAKATDRVMTGKELELLDTDMLMQHVSSIRVYARVDPAQKIRIVEALQAQGDIVAMTGDGVNDAPALKRADIGIAMGKGGTDVAREASSLVLLDDNFATIVAANREGRRIFDNMRKFIRYAMTGNSAELWVLLLAPFLGLPMPLMPIHILWINLLTDGLPGLALTAEPEENNIMQRPPRPPGEPIFAHGMWQHILWIGLTIATVSLGAQAWAIHAGTAHWQTMVFTVLTFSQMAHVLAIRSERQSLLHMGLRSNLPLLGAVALTMALQLATIYLPLLQPIFHTQPLTLMELLICFLLATIVFACVEFEKLLVRKGYLYRAFAPAGARARTGAMDG